MGWNKITLYKFQQVEEINSRLMPDLDKVLFSTCAVFDYTEYQLDNMDIKKVNKLTHKLTQIFESPFQPRPFKKIGRYFVDYDISKITLGQYIDLSFFLGLHPKNPIRAAQYIMASATHTRWRRFLNFIAPGLWPRYDAANHRKKAGYFLEVPITKITGTLSVIIEKFNAFNSEYPDLFGLDKEVSGDVQNDKFNRRYGWTYSASHVADYEKITLNQAMRLPIRQAFNDLAYLKALAKYQDEQLKQQSHGR